MLQQKGKKTEYWQEKGCKRSFFWLPVRPFADPVPSRLKWSQENGAAEGQGHASGLHPLLHQVLQLRKMGMFRAQAIQGSKGSLDKPRNQKSNMEAFFKPTKVQHGDHSTLKATKSKIWSSGSGDGHPHYRCHQFSSNGGAHDATGEPQSLSWDLPPLQFINPHLPALL